LQPVQERRSYLFVRDQFKHLKMENQDLQNGSLPLASHQELRMFKLAKRNITSTPNVPGMVTTEIPMKALYEAIHNPTLHAMTRRILPQQAYEFCDFVKSEFIRTHLAKAKMHHENSTAKIKAFTQK
jgi:hypothetical protein